MDAKTIVAIVLVAFIIGAMIWLNIRNRKEEEVTRFCRNGAACHNEPPFSYLYGGVR